MTVKELIEKLGKFDDDKKVMIEQEYNSTGGNVNVLDVSDSKYEDNVVVIEGDIY